MPLAADIYYAAAGRNHTARPAVVLIHGAGGSHLDWPGELRRIPGWCVYTLDLPGHGKSSGPGERTIAGYARRVLAWLDGLGLERAIVIGHSMGGAIGLSLALEAPQRLAGLGLLGSGARLRVVPAILESAADPAAAGRAIEALAGRFYPPDCPPEARLLSIQRLAQTRPEVLHGDLLACDQFDVRPRLAEVQAPTLVVCGSLDELTPLRYSEYLAEHIPAARLAVIPGAAHMVMLHAPQMVAAAVQGWLSGLGLWHSQVSLTGRQKGPHR
jgi:pimeloyl-ACP methyl ester carboxylesterase